MSDNPTSPTFHTGDLVPDALVLGDQFQDSTIRPGRLMVLPENGAEYSRSSAPWQFDPAMVPLWDKEIATANMWLQDVGITLNDIDEIAMLFPDQQAATTWVMDAVCDEDVHHFNAAYDRVKTSPIDSDYHVRYDFLSLKERAYRVEAMHLTGHGTSPLHAALLSARGWRDQPIPVHLSFKCHDEEAYQHAVDRLALNEFEVAQRCRSTYGIFSYWKHPEFDLYVKPRVNIRDAR